MYTFLASLAVLLAARLVNAGIYVTNPVQATTCAAGQSCQVEWVDDGTAPSLSSIGDCTVGLYTGNYQLVQSLPSVDVSSTSGLSFVPDASSGQNGPYYLVFTATNGDYRSFSGSFALTGMTGTNPSGSSVPASTPASTPAGSSVSAGSTASGTTPTDTVTTPSGSSTPALSTTESTAVTDTTTATVASTSPTLTTPTTTSHSSTSTTSTSSTTSASPSATNNAAARTGMPLGGLAALFVLSGALAF